MSTSDHNPSGKPNVTGSAALSQGSPPSNSVAGAMDSPGPRKELSTDEQHHIRLVEEYRHQARTELERARGGAGSILRVSVLLEKLLFPAALVLAGALATGWIFPKLLREHERAERMAESKNAVVNEIAGETSKIIQAWQFFSAFSQAYWSFRLNSEANLRVLRLERKAGRITEAEFAAEDAAIRALELKRDDDYLKAQLDYEVAHRAFWVWAFALESRLNAHFGINGYRMAAFATLQRSSDAAAQAIFQRVSLFGEEQNKRALKGREIEEQLAAGKLTFESARQQFEAIAKACPDAVCKPLDYKWGPGVAAADALEAAVLHSPPEAF